MDDYEQIRRRIALYAHLLDDRRWAELAALFCADGQLPWGGQTLQGPADIETGLPATQPDAPGGIKHFVFSPVIDVDGDTASAWTDVIVALVNPDSSAQMSYTGRYHDRFRREDGEWRYSSHVTVATGGALPAGQVQPPGS
jgi:hypothetical protein